MAKWVILVTHLENCSAYAFVMEESTNNRVSFGRNVRRAREGQGLSQRRLALMLNMHNTYLGRIESGRCNVSIDTMSKIASALGTTVKDLLN